MIELFYLNDAMQRMAAVQNQTKGQSPFIPPTEIDLMREVSTVYSFIPDRPR